jgi:hypothetical protein
MDLLTVLVHELGHILGRGDSTGIDVMADSLPLSVRRLPTAGAAGGLVEEVTPAFTLPPGRSVTVTVDVQIASPFPVEIGQISTQGSAVATGITALLSDDPSSR